MILTNDGLVIVDTHSKPSAAQALYKEIQGVTKKPVRKIINTHFHWDHWQGNEVYAAATPASRSSRPSALARTSPTPDAGVGGVPFIEKQIAAFAGRDREAEGRDSEGVGRRREGHLEANLAPGGGLPRRS